MPSILANLIVIAILAVVVAFAVRSIIKKRKSGGGCSGDCSSCGCNCSSGKHQ